MASANVFSVDVTQLGGLREVAGGATGRVFAAPAVRLDERWPALYKAFHPHVLPTLDVGALTRLIELLGRIGPDAERWLGDRAAWPAALVTRNGSVSGFLMRQAPPGLAPATARPAFLDDDALRGSFDAADELLSRLHEWGVTIGPVMAKNLLLGRAPALFLIGCDAVHLDGASVLPAPAGPASPATDREQLTRLRHELLAAPPAVLSEAEAATVALAAVPPPMYDTPAVAPPAYDAPAYQPGPYPPPPADVGSSGNLLRYLVFAVCAVVLIAVVAVVAIVLVRDRKDTTPPVARPPAATAPAASPSAGGAPPASASPAPSTSDSSAPPPGPVGLVDVSAVATDARASDVGSMFDAYFSSINAKQYDQAVQLYDPSGSINPNDANQRQAFAKGVATTTESAVKLLSIGADGDTVPVHVTFVSNQQPGYGPKGRENETCTQWDVTYALRSPAAHQYRIFRATKATSQPC
jgi:eukaryotic-like serine/threonine-protein kinase